MNIYTFKSDYPYGANSYVISSEGEYAIIDPAVSPEKVFKKLDIEASSFRYVILTHAHFDHTLYIDEWQEETGLPISVSSPDERMLRDSYLNCYEIFFGRKQVFLGETRVLCDGELLPLGESALKIHFVPGHTPGSILIEEGSVIFAGDTVFANQSYGRCDLPGGDFQKLKESIARIHLFAPDTDVYPGHGEKTKVKEIIRF